MSASPAPEHDVPEHDAPETRTVTTRRVACDGSGGALGHPRVWLTIPQATGWVDCPYCDTRYLLAQGAGDDH